MSANQTAIELNPSSHFPYNILGEIYVEKEMWQQAADALNQSLIIHPSNEAYNNLAIAKYHLGQIQEDSDFFLQCSRNSDYAMYSHVKCLIELGRKIEAKKKLDVFSEDDDDFVGDVEVAELYLELGCFNESIYWFDKGWGQYWKTPDWTEREKEEHIKQLLDEEKEYEHMFEKISFRIYSLDGI